MPARYVLGRMRDVARIMRGDRALVGVADTLKGAVALEPGGPSVLFGERGLIPVYSRLGALDILDYAEATIWSPTAYPDIHPRQRIIAEAGTLDGVPEDSYDVLLASHVIEHLANPLSALARWQRVVRPGGHVLVIVPHCEGTFDHLRPATSLEHLQADAAHDTGEEDLTHLEEVLEFHDLTRDPGAGDRQAFQQRCRENSSSRAMHHHVFDSRTTVDMCRSAGLDVLLLLPKAPCHIICLCQAGSSPGSGLDERQVSQILSASPFASDRQAAT